MCKFDGLAGLITTTEGFGVEESGVQVVKVLFGGQCLTLSALLLILFGVG